MRERVESPIDFILRELANTGDLGDNCSRKVKDFFETLRERTRDKKLENVELGPEL